MINPDMMWRFAQDFPDIQVTRDEIGNLEIQSRDTDREVMMQPAWMGWDEQTSIATDLRFSLVERSSKEYGRYDFNPLTGDLETVSFTGQPPLSETIALAQRGISVVQAYEQLPFDIQHRATGIVNDKSDPLSLKERLDSAAMPDITEMSASERLLFFKTMLGDLALKYL